MLSLTRVSMLGCPTPLSLPDTAAVAAMALKWPWNPQRGWKTAAAGLTG
jgi:hypothetical protein